MSERLYAITYYGPDDQEAGIIRVKTDHLLSHAEIMDYLNVALPDRPPGGWYSMASFPAEPAKEDE